MILSYVSFIGFLRGMPQSVLLFFDAFRVIMEVSFLPSGKHLTVCFGVTVDSSSPPGDRAAVPSSCPLSGLEG